MAANVLVDSGFLVALINRRDQNHTWAAAQAPTFPRPWQTCEPALSEAFYMLGQSGAPHLITLLARRALICGFQLDEHITDVIKELLSFKSLNGAFVARRVKKFMKECVARGWQHSDDLSIAAIHVGGGLCSTPKPFPA